MQQHLPPDTSREVNYYKLQNQLRHLHNFTVRHPDITVRHGSPKYGPRGGPREVGPGVLDRLLLTLLFGQSWYLILFGTNLRNAEQRNRHFPPDFSQQIVCIRPICYLLWTNHYTIMTWNKIFMFFFSGFVTHFVSLCYWVCKFSQSTDICKQAR